MIVDLKFAMHDTYVKSAKNFLKIIVNLEFHM